MVYTTEQKKELDAILKTFEGYIISENKDRKKEYSMI